MNELDEQGKALADVARALARAAALETHSELAVELQLLRDQRREVLEAARRWYNDGIKARFPAGMGPHGPTEDACAQEIAKLLGEDLDV